ncbi:hypothetical protein [Kitasatospora sp. NPDC006786]|uniref:hypothetical protein n=1 Tax=unclassified Kitasatospora TaxID=2633591 RepID=UPI00338C12B5
MGVLTDYFRAADAATVVRALELGDGGLPPLDGDGSSEKAADGADPSDLLPLAEELIALARRARAAGEQLYCWMSL